MKAQTKYFFLTLTTAAAIVALWSCGGPGKTGGGTSNGPAAIFATLYQSGTGVPVEVPCHREAITWTATSTAGSTQTQTSPAIALNDNSVLLRCDKYKPIEGNEITSCGCPRKATFTSLAPGTWTLTVLNQTCSVNVSAGTTSIVEMYTDGRACKIL